MKNWARLLRPCGIACLFLLALAPTGVHAESWDLATFFPNMERARTHSLLAEDGRGLMIFDFPGGGMWGRRFAGGCAEDWQHWGDAGLLYFGWLWSCDENPRVDWAVPPNVVLPRFFDDEKKWTTTYTNVHVTARLDKGKRWQEESSSRETVAVDVKQGVLQNGEWALRMRGRGTSGEERWWLVQCIPIEDEGGCDRGVRRYQLFDGEGSLVEEVWFGRWVRREPPPRRGLSFCAPGRETACGSQREPASR